MSNLKTFISEHWYAIASTLGIVLVWFKDNLFKVLGFKKTQELKQEDINRAHLENLEETFNLYKKIIDDLVERHEARVLALREEIGLLRARIIELETVINTLKK